MSAQIAAEVLEVCAQLILCNTLTGTVHTTQYTLHYIHNILQTLLQGVHFLLPWQLSAPGTYRSDKTQLPGNGISNYTLV